MLEFYWIRIGICQFEFTEIGIGLGEWNLIFVSIWNQNCHSMSGIRSAIKHLGEIGAGEIGNRIQKVGWNLKQNW